MMSQTRSSSGSDDSDSDQSSRRSSLGKGTRRTYQLRVNKPTVERFQAGQFLLIMFENVIFCSHEN